MFQFFKPLLVAALAVVPLVQAYANPSSCTGHCYAHDPAVVKRSDGKYYKFNTGAGIEIATASSLKGPWTLVGQVLPKGTSINGQTDLWAPDVTLVNGVYHLYYAVSTFGSQASSIGLATSTTMDPGSWTDKGATGVASSSGKPYNAIDPNLILAGSTYYLNFGSFWNDIYQVQFNSGATKPAGNPAYNLEYDAADSTHPCEGSFMFYYSGYYYLLWSQGICCGYQNSKPAAGKEYKIMMARSKSVTGGFVDKNGKAATASGGSVLLESHGTVYGPGGQGVLNDPSLGMVLYYHYADTTVGLADSQYLFGYNVLSWSNGWPVV